MNDSARSPLSKHEHASARTTGLLSAVLVVVLLASGWTDQSNLLTRPSSDGPVAACESRAPTAVRVAERLDRLVAPRLVAADAARECRVPPRTRRVDSWGWPPPRAPTA